ncbi:MAG TPA: folylpolyglutamate synthase/dihydrofolate synthase family protein [Gemmatimonadales bacterium]|nr:folylpolyglutamate synthase/dihydrofolate synthase family protein [Gemmatimonadales bacterium]
MSFADACRFLFPRQAGRIKWSLGPTQALLDVLGRPERHYPSIHVGGTNGKGSTCALIAAELEARGLRVGLYTSPHLVSVCERVLVNGVPISEDAFTEWVSFLQPHIERVDASFFEAMTVIGFADLAARGVDVAVIEVGLGGRLDATNVITPLVSVVTKIALEHTDYLGSDLKGIAREKAGIAKAGVPFVTGERTPEVREALFEEARRRGAAPLIAVDTARPPPPGVRLGLRGRFQWANAWVALEALNRLPPPFGPAGDRIPESFALAHLPGRFDVRGRWILDVAHNPDGMEVLVDTLRESAPPRPLHAVVGIRNDKEWRPMLDRLAPEVDRLVLTVAPSVPPERRWIWTDLASWAERYAGVPRQAAPLEVLFEPDFARALDLGEEGAATVLVTGSFHTVGDALARLPGFTPVERAV